MPCFSFAGGAAGRVLTATDAALLRAGAVDLPREPWAQLSPDGPLEQALLGDPTLLPALTTAAGLGVARRPYLVRDVPVRHRAPVAQLHTVTTPHG